MTADGGSEFWTGVRRMLPIAAADTLDGVAFGALAAAVMGHVAPVVMSATAFSGSAQYATVSVLRGDGTLGAALLAAAALNARYLAMSAQVAAQTDGTRWQRAAACLFLTDAAWGVAAGGTRARLMGAGAVDWLTWTLGTVVGVVGGVALGDPERLGLDAAFPALFAWLLREQLRDRPAVLAALLGATAALLLTPVLPAGLPILLAGVAGAALGLRR